MLTVLKTSSLDKLFRNSTKKWLNYLIKKKNKKKFGPEGKQKGLRYIVS